MFFICLVDRMLKEKLESMHLNGLLVMGEAGTLDEWLEVDVIMRIIHAVVI